MNRDKAFKACALSLPMPVPCAWDSVFCPWCGSVQDKIAFADNTCDSCDRYFVFNIPCNWDPLIPERPESYVPFPHLAFESLNNNPTLYTAFKPNSKLIGIYEFFNEHYPSLYQFPKSNILKFPMLKKALSKANGNGGEV